MPKISELVSTGIKGLWGTETVSAECGIPVIKTNNLSYEGVIDYTDICYRDIPKDKAEKNYLQNGDILAEKSGGTKTHSVGYVSYFNGESNKFVCNNFILALRPNREKCLSKYLFYQMRYMYENGIFADCYNRTTGIQNLQVGEYLGKSVKNPVIEEQEQAVSMLDAIVSQIDNAKGRLLALDELVKSRFIEMFTPWRVKFDTVNRYKYVLAVIGGIVKEVYEVKYWQDAERWPNDGNVDGRLEFIGQVATGDVRNLFIGKTIPAKYRKPGMASPVIYSK